MKVKVTEPKVLEDGEENTELANGAWGLGA
jgi:hypothetical protein